jgi:hypothetical protein
MRPRCLRLRCGIGACTNDNPSYKRRDGRERLKRVLGEFKHEAKCKTI